MEVFAQPAFKRSAEGWESVDPAVSAGTGEWAFEALGLVNPVHFGTTAERLVAIDGLGGEIVFSLPGAQVSAPTLGADGAVIYAGLFPGVDLELRTDGGRLGKRFILAKHGYPTNLDYFNAQCRLPSLWTSPSRAPLGADGKTPLFDYCLCCGVEFGYQDATPAGVWKYRAQWIAKGGEWDSVDQCPAEWSMDEQLKQVPSPFR